MKFKRVFKFSMLGLSRGNAEGRINSGFANVPAGLCQPFSMVMSSLSHLSAWRVFDVVQYIMFSRTSQHYILVLGNCHGWIWCMSPWCLPGESWRDDLENLLVNPDDHIQVASVWESDVMDSYLIRTVEIYFQMLCMRMLELAECMWNVLIWKTLKDW